MSRIYIALAIAAVLAGILWHDHYLSRKLKESRAQTAHESQRADQAEVQVTAERAARAHEQEIATHASNAFHGQIAALQDELSKHPLGAVIIRVPNSTAVPSTASPAGSASGPDEQTEGRIDSPVEIDIAPELTAGWLDCQMNTAQLEALQGWVRAR